MATVFWEDCDIGDALPTRRFFLEKDRVSSFAVTSGLIAPRFTDDEGARREGLPGIITPGNMTFGLLAKLLTDWSERAFLSRLGVTFRGLVLPDQEIRLEANVVGKSGRGSEPHTVELDVWLETTEGERFVTGTATVVLPTRTGG